MITGYHNLPIGKYQKTINAMMQHEDDMDAHVAMIATLQELSPEDVYNMPLMEYHEISARYAFMMQELPPAENIKEVYDLGNFHLVPTKDVKKFTTAQYIDYQHMVKEDNKIVELLSCLLVPKGCTYAVGYDLAEVQKAISDNLSVQDANNLSAFFLRKLKHSILPTLTYLGLQIMTEFPRKERKEMMNLLWRLRSIFRSGDGLNMSNQ